jgi:hypothetical protein
MRPDRKGRGEAGEGIQLLVQPIHKSNVAVAAPEKCAADNDNVIEWRILVRGRIHKRIFSSQRQKLNLWCLPFPGSRNPGENACVSLAGSLPIWAGDSCVAQSSQNAFAKILGSQKSTGANGLQAVAAHCLQAPNSRRVRAGKIALGERTPRQTLGYTTR